VFYLVTTNSVERIDKASHGNGLGYLGRVLLMGVQDGNRHPPFQVLGAG
jgi:hypothetical protein